MNQIFYTRLRHEGDPYLGLAESATRIIDEEGVMALYCASLPVDTNQGTGASKIFLDNIYTLSL